MAHPWASGATWWLSQYGLGVRPIVAGFARWEAVSRLVDGVDIAWVRGTCERFNHLRLYLFVFMCCAFVTITSASISLCSSIPLCNRHIYLIVSVFALRLDTKAPYQRRLVQFVWTSMSRAAPLSSAFHLGL